MDHSKKAGLKAALYLWSRCDVPFDNVLPDTCEKFVKIPGADIFRTNINKALSKFAEGYDLVQVYTEHTDNIGHTLGPETEGRKLAVRELDEIVLYLLQRLEDMKLTDEVNVVIVSDHGMADTAPGHIIRSELDDYLPGDGEGIENIAGKGTYINIKVVDGYLDQVYNGLDKMPGVKVYKKADIPDEFHIKKATFLQDIIIMADIGNFVMASRSDKQLPTRNDNFVYLGAHGYSPQEMKMKTIFFAHGPAFKKDLIIEPIDIVDIYQVLMHSLKVEAEPHNGTWEHVQGVFANGLSTPETNAVSKLRGTDVLISAFVLVNVVYNFF